LTVDDERFFAPFVPHFHATEGRPSIPMETYLRLMFLKYRYGLGYEPLCREVADSLTWRRFCRIPLGARVPHPTTLMKITTRCGPQAMAQFNDALLAQAAEAMLVRMHKVRTDTTVIEADVAYPTDSGLLAKAISRIGATVKKVKAAGGATRTATRDRSRSAGKRARSIAANLKRWGQGRGQAHHRRSGRPGRYRGSRGGTGGYVSLTCPASSVTPSRTNPGAIQRRTTASRSRRSASSKIGSTLETASLAIAK
jgi:IS5 family transposase